MLLLYHIGYDFRRGLQMEIQGMLRGARALGVVTVFCWRVDAERWQMILICKYTVAVPCD